MIKQEDDMFNSLKVLIDVTNKGKKNSGRAREPQQCDEPLRAPKAEPTGQSNAAPMGFIKLNYLPSGDNSASAPAPGPDPYEESNNAGEMLDGAMDNHDEAEEYRPDDEPEQLHSEVENNEEVDQAAERLE